MIIYPDGIMALVKPIKFDKISHRVCMLWHVLSGLNCLKKVKQVNTTTIKMILNVNLLIDYNRRNQVLYSIRMMMIMSKNIDHIQNQHMPILYSILVYV